MLGEPEPDVITAGAFLFCSLPLNVDQDWTTPSDFQYYGGQWAWDLWNGPALASSSTAGMLALIYDAYNQANGIYPDVETATSLLRSGADNLNYDILSQGAGHSNADRSTKLAANWDGLFLNDTSWVPGDYRGNRFEAFTKLLFPGDTANRTFTIENRNPTHDSTIDIDDSVFQRFGSRQIPLNITRTYGGMVIPGIINIEPYIALNTELLKVTITSQYEETVGNYMGELFDWTDVDDNGVMDFPEEQNRIAYAIGTNVLELRFRDPIGSVHDGLAVQVKEFGGYGISEWTIALDFYEKTDWNWLDFDGTPPTTVLAGGNETFTASMNVPNNASIGSYEGAIHIKEKEPEETIAVGVGLMKYNVTFKLWFYIPSGAQGIINDNQTTAGDRSIVPKSSVLRWNGTLLYEGKDYELLGTGGAVRFTEQYPAGSELPRYAPYFNITYLTVAAVNGYPTEEATWSGQTSVQNLVRGEDTIVVRKDSVPWNQTEDVIDLPVLTASGGETTAMLPHRNIVRNTLQLCKNGVEWPQFGGAVSEQFVATPGQNTTQLAHGNVKSGTTEIKVNDEILPQTGEVNILSNEEVQGLNSTSIQVTGQPFIVGGPPETGGSIWGSGGTWWGMLVVNAYETPWFTILQYNLYEDGYPLVDGLDFFMHTNGTHGHFTLYRDASGHFYTATYKYYNYTLKVGYLQHKNIILGSYNLYKNGFSMQEFEYTIELNTGKVTLLNFLGPNEIIEAAYKWNVYSLEQRIGKVTFSDAFIG
jgi:hypothetical protein